MAVHATLAFAAFKTALASLHRSGIRKKKVSGFLAAIIAFPLKVLQFSWPDDYLWIVGYNDDRGDAWLAESRLLKTQNATGYNQWRFLFLDHAMRLRQ